MKPASSVPHLPKAMAATPESSPKLALHQLSLYNTGRMTSDQVMAAFVARHAQRERLMAEIAAEADGSRPQHHLIVGQRGMGKTMLLARIAAGLRKDEALARRFIPLVFAEEQYAVDRLSKFWLNCLDSLADARELAQDHAAGNKIDQIVSDLNKSAMRPAKDDQPFADEVYRAFEAAAHASGQRPVLLVDNLQIVFERLDERQQHSLRELLMRAGAPILIGASPSPPPASQDYGAAFYDHFKVHYLKPLSEDEMRDLMVRLADAADRPEVRQRVMDHPQRLKVLRQLTGGNPRTTLTLFVLYAEDFALNVFKDLENLLDRVTPLYKARFEEQTEQQQVITSAVANHWDPVTTAKLAELTMLPPATLSAQIDRLEKTGILERVELFEESRNGYQLAERFLNIWFLMRGASRRQRRAVEFLTRFLESFYSSEELGHMARQLMVEENASPDHYMAGCALIPIVEPVIAAGLKRHTDLQAVNARRIAEVRSRMHELIDLKDVHAGVLAFDEMRQKLMALVPEGSELTPEAFAGAVLGSRQIFQSGERELLAAYPGKPTTQKLRELMDVIASAAEADAKEYSAEAVQWLSERLASGRIADPEDVDGWNLAFREAETKVLCQMLVDTLPENMGLRLEKEVVASIQGRLRPEGEGSASDWWFWGFDLHHKLGAYSEAADAYRRAIALDPSDVRSGINLARILEDLGQPEEAEMTYRHVLKQDCRNASAWNNLGALLMGSSERSAEAEDALRGAIAADPAHADAWSNLGLLLHKRLSRYEEAEQSYRKALALRPTHAWAWGWLGDLLDNILKRPMEAEQAYREAIANGIGDKAAWNNLGILLIKKGQDGAQEAEKILREAIELFPNNAAAWANLGLLYQLLKRFDEAHEAFREAVAMDPENCVIWTNLGELVQDHLHQFEEAEAAYRKAIAIDPTYARAWKNLGYVLQRHLHRPDEATTSYRRAIALDQKDPVSWNNLGNLLVDHYQQPAEAEHAYREGLANDPTFVPLWNSLSFLLCAHLHRYEEGEAAYQQALSLEPKNVAAWNGLGNLYCDTFYRLNEAAKAFEQALAFEPENEFVLQNSLFLHRDFMGEGAGARPLLQRIHALPKLECPDVVHLHEVLFAAYEENWGVARDFLVKAVELRKEGFVATTTEDWLRASAVLIHLNYGQALIEFLEGRGDTMARLRPWVEAVRAAQIGDKRALQNIAPEVRTVAGVLYDGIEMRLKKLPEKTRRRPLPAVPKARRPRRR